MTKHIPLTKGQFTLVDNDDYDFLMQWKWYCSSGYARRNVNRKGQYTAIHMHRVIMNTPEKMYIDHINGNKLDNRKCNLRVATKSQNNCNQGPRIATSKFKGVYWDKNNRKWVAHIRVDTKRRHLGSFVSEIDAAKAYDRAARMLHGEFAYTNFDETTEAQTTGIPF